MTSLSAAVSQNGVELRWITATEVNNYGFDVERRTEAVPQWYKIGFVQGGGTSASPRQYTFVDADIHPGDYSYRIKLRDNNGSFTYTAALEVGVGLAPKDFSLSQNYPNPFNPSTTIGFALPTSGRVVLKVYDLLGREMATLLDGQRAAGTYNLSFNAAEYSSGVYLYRLSALGNDGRKFVSTKRLTLIK
jgi:hypothetical protein